MKIVGLMLVRNGEWCLGLSLRVALQWCDSVVVLDHASTDRTWEILGDVTREGGAISYSYEPDPIWREMDYRQRLLNLGRERGATHFAMIDADEAITANAVASMRERVERLRPGQVGYVQTISCWRNPWSHRKDWGKRPISVAFADAPGLAWKPDDAGYQHHHREPYGSSQPYVDLGVEDGGCFHLQWVNWRRLIWKQRLYIVKERLLYPSITTKQINARYHHSTSEAGLVVEDVPASWWAYDGGLTRHLDLFSRGWQEDETRRVAKLLGKDGLKDLNFWGLTAEELLSNNEEAS